VRLEQLNVLAADLGKVFGLLKSPAKWVALDPIRVQGLGLRVALTGIESDSAFGQDMDECAERRARDVKDSTVNIREWGGGCELVRYKLLPRPSTLNQTSETAAAGARGKNCMF
jgi:hypothetical protein